MKHWESYGKVGRRIEESGGDRTSTRRPTEPTKQDPEGLTETEAPTKDHALTGSRTPIWIANGQVGLHGDVLVRGLSLLPDFFLITFPLAELPQQTTSEEDALNPGAT